MPLECLRNKEVEALLTQPEYTGDADTEIEQAIEGFGEFNFLPSIDAASPNPFLPEHPYLTLMAGRQKDIPIVAGEETIDLKLLADSYLTNIHRHRATRWFRPGQVRHRDLLHL